MDRSNIDKIANNPEDRILLAKITLLPTLVF